MSLFKKITIAIISLLAILLLANFGLNFWIQKKLPKVIHQNNTSPYQVTYETIKVDLLASKIFATNLVVIPKKETVKSKVKLGIYSKIESITIVNYSIWSFLFDDVIKAKNIVIDQPKVILYKKDKKAINNTDNIRKQVIDPFQQIIRVSNIYLHKGSLDIISTQKDELLLSTRNISMIIEGISIDHQSLEEKIPFKYENYVLVCDSLYYKPNDFYTIQVAKIKNKDHSLQLKNFQLLPLYTRKEFVRQLPKEKDLFAIKAPSLVINAIDWGFKNDVFFFTANSIVLDDLNATIYRNKMPKDDLSKKPLYNALLRKIKFPLKVDTLLIRNSKLVYEEEIDFTKGPAMLTFDRFNLSANNIQSGFGLKKAADLTIKINCLFMKSSALKIDWKLNVMDKSDGFNIKGSIKNFNVAALSQFTKPYINTSFKGVFDTFYFDINGNDRNSHGNASLKYNDLKVTFYKKKEPRKKAELKNLVANLILKKDSDNIAKKASVELERIEEKSFYNFLWRNIAAFLKEILI